MMSSFSSSPSFTRTFSHLTLTNNPWIQQSISPSHSQTPSSSSSSSSSSSLSLSLSSPHRIKSLDSLLDSPSRSFHSHRHCHQSHHTLLTSAYSYSPSISSSSHSHSLPLSPPLPLSASLSPSLSSSRPFSSSSSSSNFSDPSIPSHFVPNRRREARKIAKAAAAAANPNPPPKVNKNPKNIPKKIRVEFVHDLSPESAEAAALRAEEKLNQILLLKESRIVRRQEREREKEQIEENEVSFRQKRDRDREIKKKLHGMQKLKGKFTPKENENRKSLDEEEAEETQMEKENDNQNGESENDDGNESDGEDEKSPTSFMNDMKKMMKERKKSKSAEGEEGDDDDKDSRSMLAKMMKTEEQSHDNEALCPTIPKPKVLNTQKTQPSISSSPSSSPSPPRYEMDSIGRVAIPYKAYWGASTQRSLNNFPIGDEVTQRLPITFIYSLAIIKQAAARVNARFGLTNATRALIESTCEEILAGKLDSHFPLRTWQTGSGTHSNMNVNEVISNRANELSGVKIMGRKSPVHPNDDVNMSQSSNDTFPSAIQISIAKCINDHYLPKLSILYTAFTKLVESPIFINTIKIGRTHGQDATPLTFAQEFSAYQQILHENMERMRRVLPMLYELPIGGTAVGTGVNSHVGFDAFICREISVLTQLPFVSKQNKYSAISSHDVLVDISAVLSTTSSSLLKISNDIRLLSSGPHNGIGEISLPINEIGSSIMPGKVNPTQCESLSMVCCHVMGNHHTISIANTHGQFQLNTYKPLIATTLLSSMTLLGDAMESFATRCVQGITIREERVREILSLSNIAATALSPHIGYDTTIMVLNLAKKENITVREAAVRLQVGEEKDIDEWMNLVEMCGPRKIKEVPVQGVGIRGGGEREEWREEEEKEEKKEEGAMGKGN